MIPVRVGLLVRFLPCVFNATNFSHQFAEQRVPILCAFKIRRKKWNPPQKNFMNNMFLKIRTSGFPRPTKKKKNNGQHNFCWKNKKKLWNLAGGWVASWFSHGFGAGQNSKTWSFSHPRHFKHPPPPPPRRRPSSRHLLVHSGLSGAALPFHWPWGGRVLGVGKTGVAEVKTRCFTCVFLGGWI